MNEAEAIADALRRMRPRRMVAIPPMTAQPPSNAWIPRRVTVQVVLHGRLPTTVCATGAQHELRRGDLLVAAAGGVSTRRYDVARSHVSISRRVSGCGCQRFQRRADMPRDRGLQSDQAIDGAPELVALLDLLDRGVRSDLPQEALNHLARALPALVAAALERRQGDHGLLDWLRDHAHEELDRPTVAGVFGWHPDHLTRVCRTHHGKGFSQLLNRVRCEQALDLLQGHADLQSVASACGFASAGYFIRIFRRHYGCTPGQWRIADGPPA